MDKTTTVTDWSIKAITESETLQLTTVDEFLRKNCDLDPQNPESQEYIKVLKSDNLSNFFTKKFSRHNIIDIRTNLSELPNFKREAILELVKRAYSKAFVEYRELFEIYVEKLYLLKASKEERNRILESKAKEAYEIHKQDIVRPSVKQEVKAAPARARIKR